MIRGMPQQGPVAGELGGPVAVELGGPGAVESGGPGAVESGGPAAREPRGRVAARRERVVDLGLAVDRSAPAPLPDQIERELRARLGRRELHPGDALPSTRALAKELDVSRGVVVEAYDRLVRQGLLVARQGAAVRVSEAMTALPKSDLATGDALEVTELAGGDDPAGGDDRAGGDDPAASDDPATASRFAGRPWRLRLHPALTPVGTLDRRAWGAAIRTALREAPDAALASLDSASGDAGLRAALAAQLSRSRGVVTEPEHVAITSGVTDALRGLAPILHARGGRVAVEDPGFVIHRATLLGSNLEIVPVRTDADGIDVEALAEADVGAVLLTPAHQMPLGVPLSPERRGALVSWARERGALLLEDDYDGELRYDRRGVRSLHALAPDRVIYMGSTSKVLSHAVRVGWMVTPPELTGEAQGWRLACGAAPSSLIQLAFAEMVRTGAFDRGVARLRRRCAAQRAALIEALQAEAPDLTPTGVEAGLHVSVRVRGATSWSLVAAANERGVEAYAIDDGPDAILLVGFGLVEPSAARRVAAELARIVDAACAA